MEDLDIRRAKRWWRTGRRIGSLSRAAAFLEDVGFALLFPKAGVHLPSLWEATSDREIRDLGRDWGPDAERVWGWKDDLPQRGLAWYGRFLRGRPSFLSPALLVDLYPRAGRPEDIEDAGLSRDAHRIARMILRSGPLSTAALREALDVEGPRANERFDAALAELGRALVVTNFGVEDEGGGWPSAVLELTTRAFPIPTRRDIDAARARAARTFLSTTIAAKPIELASAFGWPAATARGAFDALVNDGLASRKGGVYVARAARAIRTSGAAGRPRR